MPTTPAKPPKPTGEQQVQTFLEQLEHPFKQEIEMVRNIILKANPGLTEQIKWKAPSFCFNGDDRITFNLQGKGIFRLIFHCGAKVKVRESQERLVHDTTGLLDWITAARAVVTFYRYSSYSSKGSSAHGGNK